MSSSLHDPQQKEILELRHQLDLVQKEFAAFVYTVSHDFGGPLRAVVSFSRLVSEKYESALNEKGVGYLQFVTQGGEKLQAMLAALLQYSQINTKTQVPRPVEMAALIGQCQAALGEKIALCHARIQIRGAMPEITVDARQYLQLLVALVDNALTYHRPSIAPQVEISAMDMGNYWRFTVEDNGIGISPANAERIFGAFKRLHTDADYPGVGMGLTIAKKIVMRHGGEMGMRPSESGGVCCWFTLPKILPPMENPV